MNIASHFEASELHRVGELMGLLTKALKGKFEQGGCIQVKFSPMRVLDQNGELLGKIVHEDGKFVFKAA